jgi:hypothetical protein
VEEHQIIYLLLAACNAKEIRRHSIAIQSPYFPFGSERTERYGHMSMEYISSAK